MSDQKLQQSSSTQENLKTYKPHFKTIREFVLADLVTLCNSASGSSSIFSSLKFVTTGDVNFLYLAIWLLPCAFLFDVFDGRIARWRRTESLLGQELDSLSDIISFGVAPAVLGFAIGLQGLFDCIILLYFVNCGVSRLARYNVTAEKNKVNGKVAFFEGTPIPTTVSIAMFIYYLVLTGQYLDGNIIFGKILIFGWTLHPVSFMYFISGSLMISQSILIPKL